MILKKTLDRARTLAIDDESLHRALRAWHRKDTRRMSPSRYVPFDEWLDNMIEYMSGQIAGLYDGKPPAEDIVCALRVNAEGDFLATYQADDAKRACQTDATCYVEDGIVYANVWLRSDDEEVVSYKAKEIARRFKNAGYLAEACVDEEDAREATVHAETDFPAYRYMARSGRRAEDIFKFAADCAIL